ncbi:hypothetical protein ACSQ67_015298 [Phaseolus vulgaris]
MGKASSSSSSSITSCRNNPSNSTASSLTHQHSQDLRTDLRLGLSISATQHVGSSSSGGPWQPMLPHLSSFSQATEVNDCSDHTSFFVKVYMEGIPIGRKLNLLAHDGYHEGTEMDGVQQERCHVLTYEDGEGDLIMVGDVPWEMFLSAVKRLKITRVETYG